MKCSSDGLASQCSAESDQKWYHSQDHLVVLKWENACYKDSVNHDITVFARKGIVIVEERHVPLSTSFVGNMCRFRVSVNDWNFHFINNKQWLEGNYRLKLTNIENIAKLMNISGNLSWIVFRKRNRRRICLIRGCHCLFCHQRTVSEGIQNYFRTESENNS